MKKGVHLAISVLENLEEQGPRKLQEIFSQVN